MRTKIKKTRNSWNPFNKKKWRLRVWDTDNYLVYQEEFCKRAQAEKFLKDVTPVLKNMVRNNVEEIDIWANRWEYRLNNTIDPAPRTDFPLREGFDFDFKADLLKYLNLVLINEEVGHHED